MCKGHKICGFCNTIILLPNFWRVNADLLHRDIININSTKLNYLKTELAIKD
jgi:hypothetical protein